MLFSNDRNAMRQFFKDAWQKKIKSQPLTALETIVSSVVALHPEYQKLIENNNDNLDADYSPESGMSNPFLHMGMHLAIQEQIGTDRPAGIRALYKQLLMHAPDAHRLEHKLMDCLAEMIWQALMKTVQDAHEVEHRMIECLATALWEAQSKNEMPDENRYLHCLQALIR